MRIFTRFLCAVRVGASDKTLCFAGRKNDTIYNHAVVSMRVFNENPSFVSPNALADVWMSRRILKIYFNVSRKGDK